MRIRSHAALIVMVAAGALYLPAQNPGAARGNPQTPAASGAPTAAPARRPAGRPAAYPSRPPADPAALERGKALYGVHCNFCHGSDARGGEGGPNLLRSELVLNDKNGELIRPVVQNGRPDQGMPAIRLTDAQIADVAAFIHDFKVGGYDISRMVPPSIVVGDAKAGQQYFAATCASCHSVTGDLKGIASKVTDAKVLQQTWLMPNALRRGPAQLSSPFALSPTTVTVTQASGEKTEGVLVRIDDFTVTLLDSDDNTRSFRRAGEKPLVVVHDPLQPHKDLLAKYTDKDIHNLTAYLVTVK